VSRRLSQGQLNQLETCPPLFQRNFLEQLILPQTPEQIETIEWGIRFHLLMQQRELGLFIDAFLQENPEMERSLDSLKQADSTIFADNQKSWREAEHSRTMFFDGYLLTVIYDLLILKENQATIIDWKTYLKPENKAKLANNWQTRLYLYVLAETSNYAPQEISLTYWFVKVPHQAQSITFNYNQIEHKQTEQDLRKLLTKLNQWLEDYQQENMDFPHRSDCQQHCPYYSSLVGCNHQQKSENWQKLLSEIPEISP